MTRRLLATLVAALASSLVATTLTSTPARAADPLRVLIVGDSITHGSAGDWTWRYRLWQEFQQQRVAADFVGPRNDLADNVTGQPYGSQDYLDPTFDRDHAADWGAALGWQVRRIDELTAEFRPDVIVVMLGVNNLTFLNERPEDVRDSLRRLVESARSVDPDVEVVLGKVAQQWARPTVGAFNAMVDDLAADLPGTAAADTDAGFVEGVDTWDNLHPSASGEVKIAAAMTDALAELGHLAPAARPLPRVVNGPRVKPTLTAVLAGARANLTWALPPGATGAHVWQRTGGTPWARLTDRPAVAATLTIPIPLGVRVDFAVQPVKGTLAAAEDAFSDVATLETRPPVVQPTASAPRALHVRKAGRRLVATWRAGADATRYRVLVRRGARKWRAMGWSTGTRWRSRPLPRGATYAVRVQAYRFDRPGQVGATRRVRL